MGIASEAGTHLAGSQDTPSSNMSRSTVSDISVSHADMYPPFLGEEVVNVAAVTFLRVLIMWCPEVELVWEVRRNGF